LDEIPAFPSRRAASLRRIKMHHTDHPFEKLAPGHFSACLRIQLVDLATAICEKEFPNESF
jgi:hypothetical protein